MEIEYFGHSCFSFKSKSGLVVLVDPFEASYVGLPLAKQKADVLVVSHQHPDHNAASVVAGPAVREKTFIIDAEGEYEIGGVAISTLKMNHDGNDGADRGKTLVTILRVDNVNLVHFGDLGHKLKESQVERLGPIDVVLLPLGGEYTMSTDDCLEVVEAISPSYVIPMHYKVEGMTKEFDKLLSLDEALVKCKWSVAGEPVHKIKIDANSLPEEMQVIVMNAKP